MGRLQLERVPVHANHLSFRADATAQGFQYSLGAAAQVDTVPSFADAYHV
ncbi:MAG TPA: hypothetical protein VL547_00340 [Dinghuibacter sp.]|nr:hypothetical protein [Dinghuibacter sp.]HTJ10435.1 hypothetical protein [Dinghuibacter sp.]